MTSSINIFEQASRKSLRISSERGLLSVEDLWALPLKSKTISLNSVATSLYKALESSTKSFVDDTPAATEHNDDQLRFDIVLHIIGVKKAEAAAALNAVKRREEKAKLLAVLERKQNAALEELPIEEIRKLINDL